MKKKSIIRNVFVMVALFGIFLMVPYNHDEWAWGTQEGIENLKNFFQGYNGRYFGDIISILITRSNIFKALFMTGSTIGLYLAIRRFYRTQGKFETNQKIVLLASFLLLILTPTVLFRQIYGWPAAFVNFVPPVIFIFLYLSFITESVLAEQRKNFSLLYGVLIVLGTQFFSENITIFMLILTLSIVLIERILNRKNTKFVVSAAITSIIGTILMFINPAYLNAANNTDGYKKIELSIIFIWQKMGSQIIPNMILNYKTLLLIFNIGMLVLLFTKHKRVNNMNKLLSGFIVVYTIYGLFFYGQMNFTFRYDETIINLISVLYFICLLKIIWDVFSGRELLLHLIIFMAVPFSAAPLIIAEPIGPRSFYGTYCLWLLYTGIIYLKIFSKFTLSNHYYELIKFILRVMIGSTLIFYLFIFGYMHRVQVEREKIIDESIQNGKTEIVLPLLPNENYTWKTSTGPDNWLNRFKKFYDIPEDKNVTFK